MAMEERMKKLFAVVALVLFAGVGLGQDKSWSDLWRPKVGTVYVVNEPGGKRIDCKAISILDGNRAVVRLFLVGPGIDEQKDVILKAPTAGMVDGEIYSVADVLGANRAVVSGTDSYNSVGGKRTLHVLEAAKAEEKVQPKESVNQKRRR
jgi:hypothetical protein